MNPVRRSHRGQLIGLGLGLLLVGLVTSPPFVGDGVRDVLMAAFSGVCHQLPARSPHVGGVAMAVCFRCYGIYLGLPFAAAVFPALHGRLRRLDRRAPLVLVGSLVPAGIDWTLEATGLVPGSQTMRLITGLVFGVAAGYYLVAALTPGRAAPSEAAV